MFAGIFAQLATAVSGDDGPYFPAIVRTETAPVIDAGGSIITPGQPVERPCMAQVDAVTDAMRLQDGFNQKDVRLIVLTATLAGALDTTARVEVTAGPNAGLYSVQSVARDPVGVGWDCRARKDA